MRHGLVPASGLSARAAEGGVRRRGSRRRASRVGGMGNRIGELVSFEQIVRDHFETFRTEAARVREGEGLPRFVEEEFLILRRPRY